MERFLEFIKTRRSVRKYTDQDVPEGVELVALIPIGYPARTGSAPKRRQIADFVRDESF